MLQVMWKRTRLSTLDAMLKESHLCLVDFCAPSQISVHLLI